MVWPHKSGFGIKLVRMGCRNRPYYQIGAMPSRRQTGLLPDEIIGSLDPIPNERNEILAAVDLNRLSYWMGRGARLSVGMQTLLGKKKIEKMERITLNFFRISKVWLGGFRCHQKSISKLNKKEILQL